MSDMPLHPVDGGPAGRAAYGDPDWDDERDEDEYDPSVPDADDLVDGDDWNPDD